MMASYYWSSDDEFEVERIVDARMNPKTKGLEFLIKWKGYSEFTNSWEPEGHLDHCQDLLADFLKNRKDLAIRRKTGKKRVEIPESSDIEILSDSLESEMSEDDESEEEDDEDEMELSSQEKKFLEGMTAFQKILDGVPGPKLRVANSINHEPPPSNFRYITQFIYGKGVPKPDPAFLTGCECTAECNSAACACLTQTNSQPQAISHSGHYTKEGRLRITAGRQPFIYECNQSCQCAKSKRCANRVVQRGRMVPLEIFQMGDARGWGVRAVTHIPAGTFIDLYYGEIITDNEADERYHKVYQGDARSLYLFDLDFSAEAGAKADYTVDAYNCGSVSRFFNHSCNPNLLVVPCFIDHIDQSLHFIAFFAARDIKPDQELCFDYTNELYKAASAPKLPKVYENGHIECLCGSANCRKFVYPST